MLVWSNNKDLDQVRHKLKTITEGKSVNGKDYVPLELPTYGHLNRENMYEDDVSVENAQEFIFEDMKLQR